jgi:hypothetical protein
LGWPTWSEHPLPFYERGEGDDREQDVQDEPHDPDPDETSLGWLTGMNQEVALKQSTGTYWVPGTNRTIWSTKDADLEAEHDGREPDADFEQGGDVEAEDRVERHPECVTMAPRQEEYDGREVLACDYDG